MGRFRRRMNEEYAHEFSTDESYNNAYKKVKRLTKLAIGWRSAQARLNSSLL